MGEPSTDLGRRHLEHCRSIECPCYQDGARTSATSLASITTERDALRELRDAAVALRNSLPDHWHGEAEDAFDEALAALAPTEVDEKGRGVGVGCSSCDSATWLPEVPGGGGVLTEPLNGWYFTSDTGWLCPKCAPTEPQGGE